VSHGSGAPRGLAAEGTARTTRGRFGRMFGFLEPQHPSEAAIRALLPKISTLGGFSGIPAGFTYLAQFVDHDITFDPVSQLDRLNDPHALENFRTPRLDLDSLYGSGPADQPYLYEADGVRLRVGGTRALPDLPRLGGRAVIGDPRNDVHLIIAQLHLLFIRFHNKVAERLPGRLTTDERLREAQRIVRWHYQWIVLHEFLPLVLGDELARDVRRERRFYRWDAGPFIPVEFSGGAYRFAHSMIRASYSMNSRHRDVAILAEAGPDTPATEHLTGFRPLPRGLAIDWSFFFAVGEPHRLQTSRKIDRQLNGLFKALPTVVDAERDGLIELDLRRGRALGLPSGQAIARAMGEAVLTRARCPLPAAMREAPLWYYVLCEAEALHAGEQLGPVGGRIVGEVLAGLVEGDPSSYRRRWPEWTPADEALGVFTMADLISFVESDFAQP
jgi:Animal haem peroxidase